MDARAWCYVGAWGLPGSSGRPPGGVGSGSGVVAKHAAGVLWGGNGVNLPEPARPRNEKRDCQEKVRWRTRATSNLRADFTGGRAAGPYTRRGPAAAMGVNAGNGARNRRLGV